MMMLEQMWVILALPLAGAAVNGLFGRRWPKAAVNSVALGTTGLSFVASVALVREFLALPAASVPWVKSYFTWIAAGSFRADFALQVDQLTIVMLLVVTGVGWLIHIYATGYMAHEGGYYRFFAYMNLFMFFMLLLVMAGNFLLMFVGWEGVGLASYLLIGFYFVKKSAADAGKKAFIVNRVGDFGFLLALFAIFWTFGSLDYTAVFGQAAGMTAESMGQWGMLTTICMLLLVGATGKSAQVPLYVWLPDAMEGPTPVSALIHAATMVAAGVYMVARANVLFSLSPTALFAVAIIGGLTALFAATIGIVQTDIKKVLAYSTISQLGYMFLACGVGAFAAGMFHLMTHAFFKALLFLCAGSVIHAMAGEQDMLKMGGLRRKIPWTFATMLAGTLAIAGVPGFSGFFSKDAVLWNAFSSPYGGTGLWLLGLVAALITAFYMFRLVFLTFFGKARYDEHGVHVHESPWVMLGPLVLLAVLSVAGGWVGIPAVLGGGDQFEHFLGPVFEKSAAMKAAAAMAAGVVHSAEEIHSLELQLMGLAVGAAVVGFLFAWWFYIRSPQTPERLAESMAFPYRLLMNKYYVDEIYDGLVVRPLGWISREILWRRVDDAVIDGAANGLADGARKFGGGIRRFQSGNTRSYATWVVMGALLVTGVLLWLLPR